MARLRAAFIAQERARQPADQSDQVEQAARPAPYSEKSYAPRTSVAGTGEKSVSMAYLLWFFFGGFSAHRLYIGGLPLAARQLAYLAVVFVMAFMYAATKSGLVFYGVVLALAFYWGSVLFDLFRIPGLCRRHSGNNGEGLHKIFS